MRSALHAHTSVHTYSTMEAAESSKKADHFLFIVTSFYRLTVGSDVIVGPDHLQGHTHTHTHSVILFWTINQQVAETFN